jgi:hypothetical protein
LIPRPAPRFSRHSDKRQVISVYFSRDENRQLAFCRIQPSLACVAQPASSA